MDYLNKIKENFRNKTKEERDKMIKYLIFLVSTLIVGFFLKLLKIDFSSLASILFAISFSILFLIIWTKVGISIFKSLFIVGASFSLIIFIAQEYCKVPIEARINDQSLIIFLNFGLLYIGATFIRSLYKELFGDKDSKNELTHKGAFKIFREINDGKDSWIILIIFSIVFGTFLSQLFQVLYPIINNICVYK
jgi:hypothetical protein